MDKRYLRNDQQAFGRDLGNDLFVAVGMDSTIVTSLDGMSWTGRQGGLQNSFSEIAYGNNLYVAVQNDGNVSISSDGINWTRYITGITSWIGDVVWANNMFVALTFSSDIYMSSDGINWTASYLQRGGVYPITVTYGDGQFIAMGVGDTCLTSPDGTVWTKGTLGVARRTDIIHKIDHVNSQYVAVGYPGLIMTSSDGSVWVKQTSGITEDLLGVAYGNDMFVAVGEKGTILTSPSTVSVRWPERKLSFGQPQISLYRNDIRYTLSTSGQVSIKLFDIRGLLVRTVIDSRQLSGPHTVALPTGLATSNYILSFRAGDQKINRVVLISR